MDALLAVSILKSIGVFEWFKSKFGSSPGAEVAKKVVDTAVAITGKNPAEILTVLNGDPLKAAEVAVAIQEKELELFRANAQYTLALRDKDSVDIATVNETIRAELLNSQNEAWYQKAWRPANGFSIALGSFVAVLGATWLMYEGIVHGRSEAILAIPQLATGIAMILAVPGAAVGIAAWKRGSEQIERVKAVTNI